MAEVDLTTLSIALTKAAQQTLPRVELRPATSQTSEPTAPHDPELVPPPPAVMSSFQLIPALSYRFTYLSVRYLWIEFLIEREGAGRQVIDLKLIHNLVASPPSQASEGSAPSEASGFTVPTFTSTQSITLDAATAALGVSISVMHDPSQDGRGLHTFGLSFKITSATPAKHPFITATIVKALPMES